jgi:MFS family permease
MQLMLEKDGAFEDRCQPEEELLPCDDQAVILVQIQLIATSLAVFSPFLGMFVDSFGALALMYLVSVCGSTGIALAIVASTTSIHWLYYISFSLTGLMFVGTIILMVQTGTVLPTESQRRRAITFLNVLFDAGTITYLILYKISELTGASFVQIMGGYLGVGLFCFGGAIFFWTALVRIKEREMEEEEEGEERLPPTSTEVDTITTVADVTTTTPDEQPSKLENPLQHSMLRNYYDEDRSSEEMTAGPRAVQSRNINSPGSSNNSSSSHTPKTIDRRKQWLDNNVNTPSDAENQYADNANDNQEDNGYCLIAQREPWTQLKSKQFLLMVVFFSIHLMKNNWVMATTRDFLKSLGDDEEDNFYIALFTGLSSASIVGLPFIDFLIARYGYYTALQAINLLGLVHGIVQVCSSNLNVQAFGFAVYSFYRCFTFTVSYSFLPTFLSGDVVGRGCGMMSFYSAIFSLTNMGLSAWSINGLNSSFFVPNLIYLLVMLPVFCVTRVIGKCLEQERQAAQRIHPEILDRSKHASVMLSRSFKFEYTPSAGSQRQLKMSDDSQ